MALTYYPNGLGESLGDIVATCSSLYTNNGVWYVDSQTGDNTYAGVDRLKPWATLAYAVTQASAGDVILMLSGHTETITAALDIAGLTIVGAGQSSGRPTVKLQNNQSAGSMFTSGDANKGTQILNLWLQQEAQANSSPKVFAQELYFRMRGCYVECGQYDDAEGLDMQAPDGTMVCSVKDTTFVSVATSLTAQPFRAIGYSDTGPLLLRLENVTIDSGSYGWSGAGDESCKLHATNFFAETITLGGGADVDVVSTVLGYMNVSSADGGSRVDWTAL